MSHRAPAVLTLALALGLAVAAGVASPVNAAPGWSITATPPALTVGAATDVTLIVTPGNQDIMCVTVSVPSGFTVLSVSVAKAPGATWTASRPVPGRRWQRSPPAEIRTSSRTAMPNSSSA